MTDLTRSPLRAASTLFAALALAACQLPTKIGDLPGTEGDSTAAEPTASTGEATEPDASASETGTGDTGATTGEPSDCPALAEEACNADPGCLPLYGQPDVLPGCGGEELGFVVCYDKDLDCPEGEATVCLGDDIYHVPVACVPPGTTECAGKTPRCGATECEDMPEQDCVQEQSCKPVYGNPHVEGVDGVCVDGETSVFLGCLEDTGECPPFIPTVCSVDAPDQAYEVGAGCIPPDFEQCEPPAPPCP